MVLDTDGAAHAGTVGRVGADFLELRSEGGTLEAMPFAALALLRPG